MRGPFPKASLCGALIAVGVLVALAARASGGLLVAANAVAIVKAVALAVLLRTRREEADWTRAAGAAALLVAALLTIVSTPLALAATAIGTGEIVLVERLLALLGVERRAFRSLRALLALFAATIAGAAATAPLLGLIAMALPGTIWWQAMLQAFGFDALAFLIVCPVLLTLDRPRRVAAAPRLMSEAAGIAALAGIATAAVFTQSTYPLLFVLIPVTMLAAFRLMFAGTALVLALVAAIASAATASGLGPIAHNLPALPDRMIFLQFFLAVTTASTLPVAAVLGDRARLGNRLAENERRLGRLAESSPVAIFRIDTGGIVTYGNERWRDLVGTPADPTWLTTIAPDARDAAVAVWADIHRDVRTQTIELPQRRPGGGTGATQFTLSPEHDDDGALIGWIGIATDIEARQRAERHRAANERAAAAAAARLEESNRLLTMAEGMAGVGHWRVDVASSDVFWSPEVYRIYGVDPSRRPALSDGIDAYHPDDRAMVVAHVEEAMATGESWRHFARLVRPDGTIRHVSALGQVERASDGTIIGLVGVFQDVTDRVLAEAALVAARDEAQALASAKSNFLATMSHEIRTPMTGVLGMIDLLRDEADPAERTRFLDSLAQSATLLTSVLDDVLDFSKIESGSLVLEHVDFDLAQLARRTLDLFEHAAASKGLQLTLACPFDTLPLRGDPTRLQQIVSNLISNAIKFTASGSVALSLAVWSDGGGRRVRCEVADTGIGLDEEQRGRLFEPFVQADASTTRRFGGTGLGLAISKRLVEAMAGTIGVYSTVGEGSTFWFEIALEKAERAVPALRAAPRAAARRLAILLAEDNQVNQLLVSALVRRDGHEVTCVANGRLAVEAAAARRFDAILMDMQMPEMDGLAATRAIRGGGGPCADAPIIALTADASIERRPVYEDAGLTAFLTKPVDAALLSATLASAGAAAPSAPPAPVDTEAPALDTRKLDDLARAIGQAQLATLLGMLAEEARTRPGIIDRLMALGDLASAASEGHSLKGAALGVGAMRLGQAARAIEMIEQAADQDAARRELHAAAQATLAALDGR